MARYQVILAYDGTDFYGFQRQADSSQARTVQGVFEFGLRKLAWKGNAVLAACRTDTGVHAAGQVLAFDLDWKHSDDSLRAALNSNLPPDVAVQAAVKVQPNFHPRYDAAARRYRYTIFCKPARFPLRERFAWRVWPPVEMERMQQAAEWLIGSHDFAAFGAPPKAGGTTVRNVSQAGWVFNRLDLSFEIVANAFLYHMVRRLVSFQVEIGQGKHDPDTMIACLNSEKREMVQGLAPPQGLTLVEVHYPPGIAE